MIKLPNNCEVNKYIPKKTFYNRINIPAKIKQELSSKIEKIIWKYKISEEKVNIEKTGDVEEIEVFKIYLKEKYDCKNVLEIIQKNIMYPILFEVNYNNDTRYYIEYNNEVFSTEWNENVNFEIKGMNLKVVYENLVRNVIKIKDNKSNLGLQINELKEYKSIKKQIEQLENKMRREIQFNRKVEYNQQLIKLKEILRELNNNE